MNTDFERLIADADKGNAAAQVEVARAYEFGNAPGGINYDLCYKYNKMAADQGDSLGENNVGWCYEKGYGVPVDYEEAVRWYRKSADKGNGYGASNIAHMYICELGVSFDAEAFVNYTVIGAEAGIPSCQYNLGCEFLSGKILERNVEEAQKWIEAAAKNGHQGAKQMLDNVNGDLSTIELVTDGSTNFVQTGNLTDEEFFEQQMKAANEGNAEAMNNVAIAYAEGNGVEQHLSNAVMWWKKAADGGNANAFLNLGIYYEDKEPSAAIRYLETAVEKGVALAYFHLGLIYWKREDREPDLNTAYQYMGAAAKCGIGDAQEAMKVIEAEFHNNGNGGAQNSGCMVLIVAVITCAVGCLFALA